VVYGPSMEKLRLPLLSGIVATVLAVSLGACEMLSTSSTYEDARRAFDAGQYRIANAHLADVLARGDADSRVRRLQLDLMLKLGDGNRAMAALDQLPEASFEGGERRVALAHAQILQGYPRKTAALYEALVLEDLSEQDFRMLLWALSELGEGQAFEERIEFALSRYPESPYLNALAADRLFDLGLPLDAERFARVALTNGPDTVEALLVAGRGAISQGHLEEAIAHYSKANSINPSNPLPLTNVAGLHLDLGQVEEAGEVLKIAQENHGGYPFLQWQVARHKLATGDLQGAREAKDLAQRQFADNPEFILLIADIEAALGNNGLALDNYRRFVRVAGEVPDVMQKIAELES